MIVFFSHSIVNIFFQSSKLFQNKNALIIDSDRNFSLRILSKPASSLKMTKKNDRFRSSKYMMLLLLTIFLEMNKIG